MTPESAQKPPISLPNKVLGWRSLPTVVIVIRPHLEKAFYIVTVWFCFFCFCKSCMSQSIFFAYLTSLYKALNEFWMSFYFLLLFFKYLFTVWVFILPPECFNEGPGVTRVVHHVHFLVGEVANPAGAVQIVLSFFLYICHLSFWKEISDLCFSLGKISKGGISQDGNNHKNKQESQFLIRGRAHIT